MIAPYPSPPQMIYLNGQNIIILFKDLNFMISI